MRKHSNEGPCKGRVLHRSCLAARLLGVACILLFDIRFLKRKSVSVVRHLFFMPRYDSGGEDHSHCARIGILSKPQSLPLSGL